MGSQTKPGRAIQILLVDDNAGDAKLIGRLFAEQTNKDLLLNFSVVSDGELALDFLLHRGSHQASPVTDVVILDINLPRKNGFEVLTEMRKQPHLKKTPVFMLTTSRTHEDIMKSYELDVVAFLTKPNQLADLESMVQRLLTIELPRVLRDVRKDANLAQ